MENFIDMENFDEYVERFKNLSFKDKKSLIDDINCWERSFDDFLVYDDWDDFLHGMSPTDILSCALNGRVRMFDEYLRFEIDGNLYSITKDRLEKEMDEQADEIVQVLIDEKENLLDKWNKHLYDEIFEEEEDEEIGEL